MSSPSPEKLIAIFQEARALLARPGNDFTWSSWEDSAHAVAEVDGVITKLRQGDAPIHQMHVLFAPTGPMQEASLGSGWGDEFIALANRFDEAVAPLIERLESKPRRQG